MEDLLEDGMRHLTDFVKEFYEKKEINGVDLDSGGGGVRSISMSTYKLC